MTRDSTKREMLDSVTETMGKEGFLDTELSQEEILSRKLAFKSCFEKEYRIYFKQKRNQLHSHAFHLSCFLFIGREAEMGCIKNNFYQCY